MFKKTFVLAAALAAANAHALSAGDLAFTSFNADEDGFSMVALADIGAHTTVYFGDNEWTGSAFNTGESFSKWTSGASLISAGTVIRFAAVDKATASASLGSYARESVSGSSNWGLANDKEVLYAYLGSSALAPTTFLAAITNGDFAVDGSLTGTGLVQGITAIRLNANATSTTPDFGEYTGVRSGLSTYGAYLPIINSPANWQVDATNGAYATTVPNTAAFSITPVPEPESYALALAGVGICFLLSSRRQPR